MLYALDKIEKGIDFFKPSLQKSTILVKVILVPIIYFIVMAITLAMSKAIDVVFIVSAGK